MSVKKVTGKAQGALVDKTEAWLKANDPDYQKSKKGWITPTTDALVRDKSIHPTLKELTPIDPGAKDGNYRKYPKSGNSAVTHKFENETAVKDDNA